MPRFTSIPGIPQSNITDEQAFIISTIKQNLELLIGTRGEGDLQSKAILKGDINVNTLSRQNMPQVTAKGAGFTISGQNVVSLEDYDKLRQNVQTLADDLAFTRAVLNALIKQLKG